MDKKSRVRGASSESIVGLESGDLFAKHGGQGATVPCGVWGGTPQKSSNCVSPISGVWAFSLNGGGLGLERVECA